MKSSARNQLEFPFSANEANTTTVGSPLQEPSEQKQSNGGGANSFPLPLQFPDFKPTDAAYAVAARIAGRINAASISLEEIKCLLDERQSLLDKKFAGSISRRELIRLEYVRWSLDRIEDAKYGQTLDILESYIAQYEEHRRNIASFEMQLSDLLGKKR